VRISHRLLLVALALVAGLAGSAAAVAEAKVARVKGATIVGANGKPFVVRGVTWGGDRFVPARADMALGAPTTADARRGFDQAQRLGANLIRVEVSSAAAGPEHRRALRRLQALARQKGMVLLLANVPLHDGDQAPWLEELASWFGAAGNVWILAEVDPHCGRLAASSACGNWEAWQDRQIRNIEAIRRGGLRTPVVVNLPGGSTRIDAERAAVIRGRNVVFAVHPSSRGARRFDADEAARLRTAFGTASRRLPIIVDYVAPTGLSAEGGIERLPWLRGYLGWLSAWTLQQGGDGVIGAGLDGVAASALTDRRGRPTRWGRTYGTDYLALTYRFATGQNPASGLPGGFQLGDRGPEVRRFQERLHALGYLSRAQVNGRYGDATWHAVVAFQGWHRLKRDGVAGPRLLLDLRTAERPRSTRASGARVEVDITRQVLLLIDGSGRTERIVHVSTGATGNTPTGRYAVNRKELMSWSVPFESWMPWASYFVGGFAMHEYASVPAYPASAGCVRIPAAEARMVYRFATMGMPVILYRS